MKSHAATALRWRDFPVATLRWLLRGERCMDDFRVAFAATLGVEPARVHLFGSGRAALHAYVASLGLPAGAEVLLPGYTCVVVPQVFDNLGLTLRYVDIEAGGFNPTAAAIAAAIGPRTGLVLLPHNFGLCLEGIAGLRAQFPGVAFVEDSAHAWGSRASDGRMAGTLGQAAFFSFEYSKPLTTGLGGALVVNDGSAWQPPAQHRPAASAVLRQALTLAWHRLVQTLSAPALRALQRLLRGPSRRLGVVAATSEAELQGVVQPDYGLGLHPWSAALGASQAQRAAEVWAARRAQADAYDSLLAALPQSQRPQRAAGDVLLRYPLRLPGSDRQALTLALAREGVELGCWFDDVVHPHGSRRPGYRDGDCPVGEATASCIVNLPLGLHARLDRRQSLALQKQLAGPEPRP